MNLKTVEKIEEALQEGNVKKMRKLLASIANYILDIRYRNNTASNKSYQRRMKCQKKNKKS